MQILFQLYVYFLFRPPSEAVRQVHDRSPGHASRPLGAGRTGIRAATDRTKVTTKIKGRKYRGATNLTGPSSHKAGGGRLPLSSHDQTDSFPETKTFAHSACNSTNTRKKSRERKRTESNLRSTNHSLVSLSVYGRSSPAFGLRSRERLTRSE
ncbi:hypothetical protein LY78DRAFT_662775 [Colletotrichum sublineola]|nr:hypothetical protein LY78DRAFT_662775 [Colletotrichum sublineola]